MESDPICACGHTLDEHEPDGPCAVEYEFPTGSGLDIACICAHFDWDPDA